MPQAVDLSAAQLGSQRVEVKRLARAIANGGVSTNGLTASVLGSKFIAYLGLDT